MCLPIRKLTHLSRWWRVAPTKAAKSRWPSFLSRFHICRPVCRHDVHSETPTCWILDLKNNTTAAPHFWVKRPSSQTILAIICFHSEASSPPSLPTSLLHLFPLLYFFWLPSTLGEGFPLLPLEHLLQWSPRPVLPPETCGRKSVTSPCRGGCRWNGNSLSKITQPQINAQQNSTTFIEDPVSKISAWLKL